MIKKIIIFAFLLSFADVAQAQDWSSWKNIYGIAWVDSDSAANVAKRIRYAKAMGYDGVAVASENVSNWSSNADRENLKFYIVDPYYESVLFTGNVPTGKVVKLNYGSYTQSHKDWYALNMCWVSGTATWPLNLATGYFSSGTQTRGVLWDFQQQRVIDLVCDGIKTTALALDEPSIGFVFGGCLYDVPRLFGDFHYWHEAWETGVQTTLSYWLGTDSSLLHGTITHEYATYSDGKAAFFKQLKNTLNSEFGTGNVKSVVESTFVRNNSPSTVDEWLWTLERRADANELKQDLYIVENSTFVSFLDPLIFSSTVTTNYDQVGSAHAYGVTEDGNRVLATSMGTSGAWFHWAPKFGGSPGISELPSIINVSPRLKLIRWITNQDNLAQMGTPTRSAGNEYGTISYRCNYPDDYPRSIINNRIMYSRPSWDINKIYAAVGTTTGTVTINSATRGLIRAKYVNEYFEPIATSSALVDFELSGDTISLKSSAVIEAGSWTGYVLEIGTKGVSVCTY